MVSNIFQKMKLDDHELFLKGALSGLRQFLAADTLLKGVKNAFYFTLKALSVLKMLKLLFYFFNHLEKRLDQTENVNFNQEKVFSNQAFFPQGQKVKTKH